MKKLIDYSSHGSRTKYFKDIVHQANLAIKLHKENLMLKEELATLKASLPKIKADAVRDYENSLSSCPWTANEYIKNKLEAGE